MYEVAMQDDKLWQEIKTAPSALVALDHGLEAAITKAMLRQYTMDAGSVTIALREYRRLRYLRAISAEPLRAPPLLAFIQDRDTTSSRAFRETTRQSMQATTTYLAGTLRFVSDPAYQRTLDLYRQEFTQPPMPEIWPSLTQARQKYIAMACAVADAAAIIMGNQLPSTLLNVLGCALLFPAIFFIIFFQPHWGEPRTES
jgi:hypothetical protein